MFRVKRCPRFLKWGFVWPVVSRHANYTDVENWLGRLPGLVIASIEQVPDSDAEYNFLVRDEAGRSVNVIRTEDDGPLLIGANLTFDDQVLAAVQRNADRFHVAVGSVLTNTPGAHSYTNEHGQSVPEDDFTTISLRHWIYPDGLTEHELNSTIIEFLQTMAYIQGTASRLVEDPELLA